MQGGIKLLTTSLASLKLYVNNDNNDIYKCIANQCQNQK